MKHTHPLQKRRKLGTQNGLKTPRWRSWIRPSGSSDLSLTAVFVSSLCTTSMFYGSPSVMMLVFAFHPPLLFLFCPYILMSLKRLSFFFHCCSFWSFFLSSGVQAWLCSDPTDIPDHPYPDLWLSSLTPEAHVFPLPDGKSTQPNVHVFGPRAKLEKPPMGFTGWTCKVHIETWTRI